jgi:hypothetical protein
MTVEELIARLPLKVAAGGGRLRDDITGGYACDLLSIVMAQAAAGHVWVTMQGHQNIIAVASLLGLAAVIVAGGAALDRTTVDKAVKENVVLLVTDLPAFEVIGRMYSIGIKGL